MAGLKRLSVLTLLSLALIRTGHAVLPGFLQIELAVSGPPQSQAFVRTFLEQRLDLRATAGAHWVPSPDSGRLILEMPQVIDEAALLARIVRRPTVIVFRRHLFETRVRILDAADFTTVEKSADGFAVHLSASGAARLEQETSGGHCTLELSFEGGGIGTIWFLEVPITDGVLPFPLNADQAAFIRYAMAPAAIRVVRIERGHW